MSLRLKLLLSLVTLLLVISSYLAFVWIPTARAEERTHYMGYTRAHLATLAVALVDPLLKNDLSQLYSILDDLSAKNLNWLNLQLYDDHGILLYPLVEQAFSTAGGAELVTLVLPVKHQDRNIGRLVLQSDLSGFISEEMEGAWTLLFAVLTALLSYVLLVLIAAEWFLHRPLLQLTAAARRLGSGDYEASLPAHGQDEIGTLVSSFAGMRDAIGSAHRELSDKIAAHQESERALRASEHRLSVVLDNTVDGIITIDANGAIESFNHAAAHMFGYSATEVLGRSISMLMPAAHDGAVDEFPDLYDLTNEMHIHGQLREMVAKRCDGTLFQVEIAINEVAVDKQVIYTGIVRDITARKRSEEALRNAHDAALAATRIKSEFLANMSHEIRTPLNGVLGMLQLLCDGPLPAEQRDQAETAHQSGQALLAVLNDTLDFSKIEAGYLQLESVSFNLRDMIEGALGALAPSTTHKQLELGCLIDRRIPDVARGDPTRLRQVLMNLISNAVKFTEHGEIFVNVVCNDAEDRQHAPESRDKTIHLRFEVSDTGIGIPSAVQAQIFDSFAQADGSTTRTHGGTGLGLAISKKLVELMNGAIGVQSEPGRGSVFWFTVCLETGKEAGVFAPDPRLAGRRALIAGNNSLQRMALQQLLENFGVQHDLAVGDGEVLARLRVAKEDGTPYDVVLLDSGYPEPESQSLLRVLAGESVLHVTQLILLLPYGRRYGGPSAAAPGAVLTKPLRRIKFHDALVEILTPGSKAARQDSMTDAVLCSGRILVAEDNPVNQKVIAGLLRRLGYVVEIAADGHAALAAYKRGGFEAVFMDCQMPGLDGYATTRAIRAQETEQAVSGAVPARIPIIAMTAHAIAGDREKCLAAGMDDYLTKPIDPPMLRERLAAWLAPRVGSLARGQTPLHEVTVSTSTVTLDRLRFDSVRAELPDEYVEIVQAYLQDTPQRITALRHAASRDELRETAHHLKGSSSSLGVVRLADLCQHLEHSAPDLTEPEIIVHLEEIESEYSLVQVALRSAAPAVGSTAI